VGSFTSDLGLRPLMTEWTAGPDPRSRQNRHKASSGSHRPEAIYRRGMVQPRLAPCRVWRPNEVWGERVTSEASKGAPEGTHPVGNGASAPRLKAVPSSGWIVGLFVHRSWRP
jgi:hypothetical protein